MLLKNWYLYIILVLAVAGGFYWVNRTDMAITENPKIVLNNDGSKINESTKIHAWVYPGEPSCRAEKEIKDGRKIDVLRAEYFALNETGSVELLTEENYGCNGFSKKNIDLIKANSTEQFVTISGSEEKMSKFFADQDVVNKGVSTIVDFVKMNDLTGAEIDFEDFSSWSQSDYTGYKKFVEQIGNELNKNNKKLIVDGPPIGNVEEQGWYKWKYSDFNSLPVDYITVMAYDYQTDQGAGSPIAPNDWVINIINWTMREIPDKEKIVIGIPSYGYSSDVGSYRFTTLTSEQMASEVGLNNFNYDADSFEQRKTINGIVYTYISQENLDSKRAIIENLGIKNISVWHLGGNEWFSRD